MGSDQEVVVKVVSGEPEAQIACGLLRSAGIDCFYRDTVAIDSAFEDFTAAGQREIVVREADAEAARELLAAPALEGEDPPHTEVDPGGEEDVHGK